MDGDIVQESDLSGLRVDGNFGDIDEEPIGGRGVYPVLLIRWRYRWDSVIAGLKHSWLNAGRKLCRIPVRESSKTFEGKFGIALSMIHAACSYSEFCFRHMQLFSSKAQKFVFYTHGCSIDGA